MSYQIREIHISDLVHEIEQQRRDLSAIWMNATLQYDRSLFFILSISRYVAILTSILALWSIRNRPIYIMKVIKRALNLWRTWRLVKSMLKIN